MLIYKFSDIVDNSQYTSPCQSLLSKDHLVINLSFLLSGILSWLVSVLLACQRRFGFGCCRLYIDWRRFILPDLFDAAYIGFSKSFKTIFCFRHVVKTV